MGTMNISLPDSLKEFVERQVAQCGYGTSSEYVRELIRKDQDRAALRSLILEGAASAPTEPADDAYFDRLRTRIRQQRTG
ncbi:type II toxin-antitoxin system ParD family antitoxin [Mycolicibacter longobardus]|uniref:Addiction module antitoxin n=1 Tax=Mycolicibacter longobardus TaxID=1108812 RepID=A0A1X1YKC8_9MYCO|nr:type II toxin-antitoxin system ParD family antitoxin [Mycolicibacter longobardus]MCV7383944.1 type II toxin-antitoxin system ParD family antitoxin [Mycolicibacter longobardus]ORW11548.1 addiction module antitoxin [Mycolicibacter longobardus]